MNLRINSFAAQEVYEAVAYFELQQPGLGFQFSDQFRLGLESIRAYPHAWSVFDEPIRRYRVGKFRYGIMYVPDPDLIHVLGLMPLVMDPKRWRIELQSRLGG